MELAHRDTHGKLGKITVPKSVLINLIIEETQKLKIELQEETIKAAEIKKQAEDLKAKQLQEKYEKIYEHGYTNGVKDENNRVMKYIDNLRARGYRYIS